MSRQMWYATVETPGVFAVLRGECWTLLIMGKGTPVNDLQVATRLTMTREERNAGRAAWGMPQIEDEPLAPERLYREDLTWDHSFVPPGHGIEEAPDGVLQAIAEWQMARDRDAAEREADDLLASTEEGRSDVG